MGLARRDVKLADYIRALTADGRSPLEPHDATVTPRCTRGWLGMAVSWTWLEHLTRSWWDRRVLSVHQRILLGRLADAATAAPSPSQSSMSWSAHIACSMASSIDALAMWLGVSMVSVHKPP